MADPDKSVPDKLTPNAGSDPPLGAIFVVYFGAFAIFLLFGFFTPPDRWMPQGKPWHLIAQIGWLALAIGCSLAWLLWGRKQVRKHYGPSHLCKHCGYDNRGSTAQCPECGRRPNDMPS